MPPARTKAILRTLSDRLKTDLNNKSKLKHYLDEAFTKKT